MSDANRQGRTTEFFAFPVGQSCCSALNSWAAQQRRPTKDAKILVLHPSQFGMEVSAAEA